MNKEWQIQKVVLIADMHGSDGVGKGVVICMEPVLFGSVADSIWSPKVIKLYNLRDQKLLQLVARVCLQKTIEKCSRNVGKSIEIQLLPFEPMFCFDHMINTRETRNLIGPSQ